MKTKFIYILLILILMGCSKDDGDGQPIEIPADKKFADRIDMIGENGKASQFINFEYNSEKQLSRIDFTPLFVMDYTYENDELIGVNFLGSEGNVSFVFEYDDTGRLITITKDEEAFNVVFDNVANSYEIELGEEGSVLFSMNGNEDVEEIQFLDGENMPQSTQAYLYAAEQYNGTMANVHNVHMATAMVLSTSEEYDGFVLIALAYISKKPVVNFASSDFGVIATTNTYDDQNFLDTFSLIAGGANGETFKVIYQQIE